MPTRARAKTAKEPAKTATKAAKTEKPRKKEWVLYYEKLFFGLFSPNG